VTKIVPMQPYPGYPLRSLKQFAADADRMVRRYNQLSNLPDVACQKIEAMKNDERIDDLNELIATAKKAATLSKHDEATLAQCEAALERLDPASNYEDNGQGSLKRGVIGERIAVLVGAFPNAAPSDPAVFVRMLIESICSVDLSLPALDAAIWQIVGTKKFIPAVSEVLEVVTKQQGDWSTRVCAIQCIAETSSWALAEIEELQVEAEKAAKARAVQEAQRDLNWALHQRSKAIAEAVKAQHQAAAAAQAVAEAMEKLAQCDAEVLEKEKALAEAVASNGEVRP
jgi:hypothetical protein